MLWCKSIIAVTLLCMLTACGFQPLYGETAMRADNLPAIEIANIPDREGQYLRNALIDRLNEKGRVTAAAYRLQLSPLEKDVTNIGIRKDATVTRAQITFITTLQLIDTATGSVALERQVKSYTAHNMLDNQLSTLLSERSVVDGALNKLSDDIEREILLYFDRTYKP